MLSRALLVMDADIIIKMGFFVGDLHRQVEQLHKDQFDGGHSAESFIVYRYEDRENEVLFTMHTVFRICDIKQMGENKRLRQVNLTMTSDNDPDLSHLTNQIQEETFPGEKGWSRLGSLLFKLGQSEKAQQVYEMLVGR
jgi:hypothetical protein